MQSKFYVYALIDPRNDQPFYIGKGCGNRMFQHVAEYRRGIVSNAEKFKRIAAIHAAGKSVRHAKIAEGLTESEALKYERRLIAEIGFKNLTNVLPGELTAMEKSRVTAQVLLDRLKSRNQWLAERPRSEFEVALADRVRQELEHIAQYGQASEIIVTAGGVELR